MYRILITGGAGFIGSTLAKAFLDEDLEVRIFDNYSRDSLSEKPFAKDPRLSVVRGDILDAEAVIEAAKGCDEIIHCAGIAGIDTVVIKPSLTMRVNMIGTANALEAARLAGVKLFVDFSTSEVFGSSSFRNAESDKTTIGSASEARWIYAVSKLAGEHLAIAYYKDFGVPAVTLRPFNVYGPGQIGEGALQKFILGALQGQDLRIFGEGNQIRAWCYIEDFVRAVQLVRNSPAAIGESFNIGNARAVVTIYGLAETVLRVLDSPSQIRFEPARTADVDLRVPRVDKARNLLGFEAQVDLPDGILRTAAYYAQRLNITPVRRRGA